MEKRYDIPEKSAFIAKGGEFKDMTLGLQVTFIEILLLFSNS